jgi:hypothetical protein
MKTTWLEKVRLLLAENKLCELKRFVDDAEEQFRQSGFATSAKKDMSEVPVYSRCRSERRMAPSWPGDVRKKTKGRFTFPNGPFASCESRLFLTDDELRIRRGRARRHEHNL